MSESLKVFISWSGGLAQQVAIDLRELLPLIFDHVAPWVSDRDIEAGGRSMHEIARELDETAFGIIVTTRENQTSQWLNFEAGALSKRFGSDNGTHVIPLLVDMDAIAELTGPLTQFQAKLLTKAGLQDILVALGAALSVEETVVKRRLSGEWSEFESKLVTAKSKARHPSQQPKRGVESMVEETLELVRAMANAESNSHVSPSVTASLRERRRRGMKDLFDLHAFANAEGISTWQLDLNGKYPKIIIDDPALAADRSRLGSMYGKIAAHLAGNGFTDHFELIVNGQEQPPF